MNGKRDKRTLNAFGRNLRRLRLIKGLSQEALEFDSGLSKNVVGNIERGEANPTFTTIKALSKGLGVPIKDMVDF
ncbi:MAG TPA: helix-turn-helix transcriptional regulator [Bacteroidia bacterium]|nr:helix-turn-helix transcriptional regulator [Bacteroidia bacterium]